MKKVRGSRGVEILWTERRAGGASRRGGGNQGGPPVARVILIARAVFTHVILGGSFRAELGRKSLHQGGNRAGLAVAFEEFKGHP